MFRPFFVCYRRYCLNWKKYYHILNVLVQTLLANQKNQRAYIIIEILFYISIISCVIRKLIRPHISQQSAMILFLSTVHTAVVKHKQ